MALEPLKFGMVTGRLVATIADSAGDMDRDPDVQPLTGGVTFTPAASALLLPGASPDPATALPMPITATLDDKGYLSHSGVRGVRLVASVNNATNPSDFTYKVSFSLKLGTLSVQYPAFDITVPADGVVDLTTVAPVPRATGTPMIQGVGIADVQIRNGEFVVLLTDGSERNAGLVPTATGEALVSVTEVTEGHYTVNGSSIMGLAADGTLPAVAASEVQSIADASASSAALAVNENVTLVESRVKALEDAPAIDSPTTGAERCVDGVVLEGSNLVLSFTDGTSESVDLSALKGAAGENETPGSGITPTPAPNTEARRAVILGDSHSDTAWPQADGVWWWQTAADLSGVTVLDVYAAGGMTTRDALNGWDDNEGGLTTPQIVQAEASGADLAIMEFGGNDVSNGIDATEYRANLTEMTQRLMASGKRVLIMAPPPLFAGAEERIVAQYAEYRRIDEEVAAACSAYYVDAWDAIGTGPGGSLPSSYDSGDHIHMNSYGQMALGEAIAPNLQRVAGVVDPYDGVRDIRWFGWETVQGDKNLVLSEPGPQDALFKGAEVAVVTTPAEDTNAAVTIYSEFNSTPGAVWEVSYAYRIESSTGRANITPSLAVWPGGFVTEYPQRDRLVGLEGVRRYEVTIPEEATDGAAFFLNLPAVAGKLTARIGMLGMRLIKESPLILEPTPEP